MLIHENVFLKDRLQISLQTEANLSKLINLYSHSKPPESLILCWFQGETKLTRLILKAKLETIP